MGMVYLASHKNTIDTRMTLSMLWERGDTPVSAELMCPSYYCDKWEDRLEDVEKVQLLRRSLIPNCDYVIILCLDGWQHSDNMSRTISDAADAGKRIAYMDHSYWSRDENVSKAK